MKKGKPSTCLCKGRFKTHSELWVVIHRRKEPNTSQLKCLKCKWKWWSKRNYIKSLKDHKERTRRGCTNEMVLERILNKTLSVDPHTSEVTSYLRTKKLKQIPDRQNGGYLFVEVCVQGRKKKIAVHVLQWIQANKRLPPPGYDVHHKVSPPRPLPKDNALSNLELKESSKNRSNPLNSETDDF
jgi:hypothetical protein